LLYLAVAGGLLLLRQIKTFRLGQLKLELIERIRERQDRQEERLADIGLILPLLLPDKEVSHIKNLFEQHQTNAREATHCEPNSVVSLRWDYCHEKRVGAFVT